MSERDDGAFAVPFGQMDEAEIIAHFKRYGFTDELGMRLSCARIFWIWWSWPPGAAV